MKRQGHERRGVDGRISREDLLLELLTGGSRLEAELLGEQASSLLVGAQRLSLSARAVQREHQPGRAAAPERGLR
jgi:hypothetical protein